MEYEWDEAKRQANLVKHGTDFTDAHQFEWDTAISEPDRRFPYPEERIESVGFIGPRLFVLVWTEREDQVCRVISLRKANRREVRDYERAYEEGRVPGPHPGGAGRHH